MTYEAPTPTPASARTGKTVQEYIDETPVWADATPVHFAPITGMQWLIWWLAAAGKFFEGIVVFMTGVAVWPGDIPDGCSGTWPTHHHCMDSAAKEAIHAVARGVDHGPAA